MVYYAHATGRSLKYVPPNSCLSKNGSMNEKHIKDSPKEMPDQCDHILQKIATLAKFCLF